MRAQHTVLVQGLKPTHHIILIVTVGGVRISRGPSGTGTPLGKSHASALENEAFTIPTEIACATPPGTSMSPTRRHPAKPLRSLFCFCSCTLDILNFCQYTAAQGYFSNPPLWRVLEDALSGPLLEGSENPLESSTVGSRRQHRLAWGVPSPRE